MFVLGLVAGAVAYFVYQPAAFAVAVPRSLGALVGAGVLVGFGTRLGSGCTSGHGVCGVGRLSVRSVFGMMMFTATGAITVFVINRYFGGVL